MLASFVKSVSSDYASIVSINIFVALLCACIVVGHLLEENRWMNESITALLIGLCTGVVILLTTQGKSSRIFVFSEDLFFIYLLPPIIFNAGFQVKKKQFFRNFTTIMLFGALGTMISFVIISFGAMGLFEKLNIGELGISDYLSIGAIFAATDSVCTLQVICWLRRTLSLWFCHFTLFFIAQLMLTSCYITKLPYQYYGNEVLNQDETPLLYSVVFGEGVVNDATSVVLFNAIQDFDLAHFDGVTVLKFIGNFLYLFSASTILGVVAGLLSAFVIKKLCFGRHSTDREVALMMLMAYLSYMLAELLDLSGILTVFFCGIVMSHYTWHNVTENSRITTKHTFATLSFISEIFLFLYVGMDALDIEKWEFASNTPGKSIALSSIILGLVMVARAAFVFPLSFLSNLGKKNAHEKITLNKQALIWWAGLMRGAVSIALAYNKFTAAGHTQLSTNAIMITSTIIVVLFSTVVFGLLTKPLVCLLIPPKYNDPTGSMISDISTTSFTDPLLTSEIEIGGNNTNLPRPPNLRMLFTQPTRSVHRYWRKFDDRFMRPVFGGRGFAPFVPGSPTERSLPEPGTIPEEE